MARKTAAERRAEEQAKAEAALEALMEFRAKRAMPFMYRLQEQARELSLPVRVALEAEGLVLYVKLNQDWEERLDTFETEEWEFESLERQLRELREERERAAERARLAAVTADRLAAELSPEALKALADLLASKVRK